MPELKALIFDLDGVIADTVGLHYRAWKQLFDELHVDFSRADMDRFRGIHQRQILQTYAPNLGEAQMAVCLAQKDAHYKQMLADERDQILHAPAIRLLHDARAHGLKIGLASSSISARHVLQITGIAPLFDAVADGSTVCRPKPAPDIFVWVAGALGVSPPEVAVIEDGRAGVEAARIAGMFVVGIDVNDSPYPPHLNLTLDTLDFAMLADSFGHGSLIDTRSL